MFKWLGEMIGQSSTKAPDGVPAQWLFRLENLLTLVDGSSHTLREGLTRDMLGYVLHGTPQGVLKEAGELGVLVKELRLLRYFAYAEQIEHDIYEHFEELPVEVALRYARLLAAFGPPYALLCMQLPQDMRWPEVLMVHASRSQITCLSSRPPKPSSLSVKRLESLLVAAGEAPTALLVAAFATPINTANPTNKELWAQRLAMVSQLAGYPEALDRHLELVRPLLLPTQLVQRKHTVNMLSNADPATLARLAPELCELFMTASQPVQTAAEALLRRVPEAAINPLRAMASTGSPKRRAQAQHLLTRCVEGGVADAATHPIQRVPVIDWSAEGNAVAPGFLSIFWHRVNNHIADHNERLLRHGVQVVANARRSLQPSKPYDEDDEWALQAYLASDERRETKQPRDQETAWMHVAPVLEQMASEGLTPVALFRTLLFFNLAGDAEGKLLYPAVRAFNALHRHCHRPTLLELACMMDDAGLSGPALRRNFCNTWADAIAEDWEPDAIWPYFMHHTEAVARALLSTSDNEPGFRPGLYRALSMLPSLPEPVVDALFQLALGSSAKARPPAQEVLARYPGKEGRIVSTLGNGKATTRAAAAEWLGRLRYRPALTALEKALSCEKQAASRRAMLDAIKSINEAAPQA